MLCDGDRVLVCLSGGKDSLSLLHTLWQYRFISTAKGVNFTIGAVTVDPGSASYNPRPLIPYLAALGVPYFYEEQGRLHVLQSVYMVVCSVWGVDYVQQLWDICRYPAKGSLTWGGLCLHL